MVESHPVDKCFLFLTPSGPHSGPINALFVHFWSGFQAVAQKLDLLDLNGPTNQSYPINQSRSSLQQFSVLYEKTSKVVLTMMVELRQTNTFSFYSYLRIRSNKLMYDDNVFMRKYAHIWF